MEAWRAFGRQLQHPQGSLGLLTGWVMRVANSGLNRLALQALEVAPNHDVLELGFGPGLGIKAAAALNPLGTVYGVDHSDLMLRQARRRNAADVRSGHVRLFEGRFDNLPLAAGAVDRILAVNVIYFWRDGRAVLSEIRRVLRPGGRAVIYATDESAMRDWPLADPETHRLFDARSLAAFLADGGFGPDEVEIESVQAAFGVPGLLAIIRNGRAPVADNQRQTNMDQPQSPPVGSRRRSFLAGTLLAAGLTLGPRPTRAAVTTTIKMGRSPLVQPPLPFAAGALEPVISERTIGFHYGKHHKAYFDNLNKLVAGGPLAEKSLEEIILQAAGDKTQVAVFNNAAQAWNHSFYWRSLSASPQAPSGALAAAIVRDFGSLDALNKQLAAVAVGQFGSGWAWLVSDRGKLAVVSTGNADIPFLHDQTPLLTIDVWEHAYYLDVQNRRADYVNGVIGKLLNWDFAAQNLATAGGNRSI